MGIVSLLPSEAYDSDRLREDMEQHFRLLKVEIPPEQTVVIKPNLIIRCTPDRCATLHPAVLEAVLSLLRDRGVKHITIAESPGGPHTAALLKSLFVQTGMAETAKKYGVECCTDTGSHVIRGENNQLCREFEVLDAITPEVYLISMCKVKTHGMMTFSGGVKNLFGCIPGLLKAQLHYRFPEEEAFARMLVDLAQTLTPQLTIADGIIGMEGDGPTAGTPKKLGITAAACYDGLYDLDAVLADMIGMNREQIPTVRESITRGLCRPDKITVLGTPDLASQIVPFQLPAGKSLDFSKNLGLLGPLVRRLKPYLAPRPRIRTSVCIGCAKCAAACPAHVITIQDRKAVIDPKGCIRCFCCHELCPEQAVHIQETKVFRMLSH